MCLDCLTFQPSDCNRARTLCSESPTIKRSFAVTTDASKSAFSSGPNKSSKEALDFRRRDRLAGVAVRRVLRVGADDVTAGLRVVLRVLRTGPSSVVGGGADDRRVFRTGSVDSWLTSSLVGVLGRALGRPLGRVLGGPWRDGVEEGG